MHWIVIGFALGVWLCQQQDALLPLDLVGAAFALTLAFSLLLKRRMRPLGHALLILAGVSAGFGYADWRGGLRLSDALSSTYEGRDIQLTGQIADLPHSQERSIRFVFETCHAPKGIPSSIVLTWYGGKNSVPPVLHAGQRWLLTVRLRQAHGSLNPNGFDYEGWLFERGVRATGYVRPEGNSLLTDFDASPMSLINAIREQIRGRFERTLPDSAWRGVLVALAIGDQASVPSEQWVLFRKTGTTHLMSISGLHVTLVASLLAFFTGFVWRRCPVLALRLPAQKAAILAAVLSAAAYVLLAGCGVPAQRTLYMLVAAALALWLERGSTATRVMSLALLTVLLLDPWAVLSPGFWLSFGAVSALLVMTRSRSRSRVQTRWRWISNWLRAQWAVTLFTLPVLLLLFQQFSLVSPVANAVAIPMVSVVITPLALLFAVLPLPSVAGLADWLLNLLMVFLHWCADLPGAMWQQAAPPGWLTVLCSLAALWTLLPKGVPGRWVGLLVFVPLLAWSPPRPGHGAAQVTVLDVGQGLAVHVRTEGHDLLFDTGPQYSPETDAGERIVVPYLRAEGVRHLDMLVVSHNDADHSGGAGSVLEELDVRDLRASVPWYSKLHQAPIPLHDCLDGQRWEWDGVRFSFLNPAPEQIGAGNEGSCVLRIAVGGQVVLLTGDAEKFAEAAMLAKYGSSLRADIIVVPHHGSRGSSSEEFVYATRARYAVFTAGYLNRYHHPAPDVVARYMKIGAVLLRSDTDGAVRFGLNNTQIEPWRARKSMKRYWHQVIR